MAEDPLAALAHDAGVLVDWEDARGDPQTVSPDSLRTLLEAMDLPCGAPSQIRESRERLHRNAAAAGAAFMTLDVGAPIVLPVAARSSHAKLHIEGGGAQDVRLVTAADGVWLPPVETPGYHRLELDDREIVLAAAPPQAKRLDDLASGRLWGVGVQVYALRGERTAGFGDFGALEAFAAAAASQGADAVAISPVHALFAADPSRFSPYAPSTRLFLNGLYADPAALFPEFQVPVEPAGGELIDWPSAAPRRLAALRELYDRARSLREDPRWADFQAFRSAGGSDLEGHARFEALHARFFATTGAAGWPAWPAEFQDHHSSAVAEFARAHAQEVEFHAFLQWLADRGLASAQSVAQRAGMAVGLIADMAVGMDPGGSHAWSRPDDLLKGLSVGAPPDVFQPQGQDWGIAAFSPQALRVSGYAGFVATLRAAMRHAGGVRIDHAMGLRRLWLTPRGGGPGDGAYLLYPFEDMLRLLALESHRAGVVVIGEDLGTVPPGFRKATEAKGVMGMRVLWFERDEAGGFRSPRTWSDDAAALSTTHDLPTVAGWWRGRDIDWDVRLGRTVDEAGVRTQRDLDRDRLWAACERADVVQGSAPGQDDPEPAVAAALGFIGSTPCRLALAQIEDLLAEPEQPNLPGSIDQHPNWRRRLPTPPAALFADPKVAARVTVLNTTRGRTATGSRT